MFEGKSTMGKMSQVFGKTVQLSSIKFYKPSLIAADGHEIMYEGPDLELRNPEMMEKVRSIHRNLNIASTFYIEAPIPSRNCLAVIKFVKKLDLEKNLDCDMFFFVYNDYEEKLQTWRQKMADCRELKLTEKSRVGSLLEVPIGGLFGMEGPNGAYYFRARIVKINLKSKSITYWGVDEGELGTCEIKDLIHLTQDLVSLDMLMIPGIFNEEPKPNQLLKFESKKFCLGDIRQPDLKFDYAPRKVTLK